jgi:hypothetical protein
MKTLLMFTGAALLLAVGFFFYELKRPASHLDVATETASPPQGALRVAEATRPMPRPPEMAKLKPVPYVVPKDMRDPERLPLRHPVMAGPSHAPPPDPFSLPKTELVARGGTIP